MRRETQNVLLVLVGGVLIKIVLDGTVLRYVAPWSAPVVLAAGVVVVALACAAIVRDLRAGDGGPDQGSDGHEGADGHARSAWLMVLPVLAILLVAPPALGSGALVDGRARAVTPSPASAAEPLPPGPAPALPVVDFVTRAAADPRGPLTGRDVTLTGFLAPGPAPGTTDLARFVISCCAADASAVRVHLSGLPAAAPTGGPDRWVQVKGRLVAGTGTAADGHVPTLTVTESLPVSPPEQVYEY